MRSISTTLHGALVVLLGWAGMGVARGELPPDQIEFFERRIRPVLAQDCYECHRTGVSEKGGLALDHREALLKGGRSGPALVPGDPEGSLLLRAMRHESEELKMPKSAPKLDDSIIADFERWIGLGAPDPRDSPPSEEEVAADTGWPVIMERRKEWWSFQPIRKPDEPEIAGVTHPVDRFIRNKLREAGLIQSPPADPAALLRRLSFALKGLPPDPADVERFRQEPGEEAYLGYIDAFLDSPQYGERWARHWMDWFRYADSHGSEGDPGIPYSWRYRDYLIRALNADVPYDQLVKEHLAGDLLAEPRINRDLGLNESALGIAHFRMIQHGFAPTDALDERVRNIDEQIDVISKAFLGLTVSCARCHDHKFDAISQNDFYAMYGVLASTMPISIGVDARDERVEEMRRQIAGLKGEIKRAMAEAWREGKERFVSRLIEPDEALRGAIENASDPGSILHVFYLAKKQGEGADLAEVVGKWKGLFGEMDKVALAGDLTARWDLTERSGGGGWRRDGAAQAAAAGEFTVGLNGDRIVQAIHPAGMYSHLVSSKDRAVLTSPSVALDEHYDLWMRVAGDGGAMARYVVQGYPRDGSVYPVNRLNGGGWRWIQHPLDYWTGDRIHVEFSTAADPAVLANTSAERSWFGVREVIILPQGSPKPDEPKLAARLAQQALEFAGANQVEGAARLYSKLLLESIEAWMDERLTDRQALFLDQLLQLELLENSLAALPGVEPLVRSLRELEERLPVPTRSPGLMEVEAKDQPLFIRGDHKLPGEPVPRKFLDAFTAEPYETEQSGRLELARDFLRPENPFTARVIVNRVWHHLFGSGIVATTDNFGRLGEEPSHPELLDYLAVWFVENGYSIKKLARLIVTSETWRASSNPPPGARELDPENRLLSHASVRRLEAEAIRDALLSVSGELDPEMHGPPVKGESRRRSVYLRVQRNDLDPFLATFDAPVPSATRGNRDVTTVPAQSLAMLNDPFVLELAERWAERLGREIPGRTDRIERMFQSALSRGPEAGEREGIERFLEEFTQRQEEFARQREELERRVVATERELAKLSDEGKERVRASRASGAEARSSLPEPVGAWDFSIDLRDQAGGLHGTAHGNARIDQGALVLDGRGSYVSTPPLDRTLAAKTLEAWVRLENLEQRGGGVITVQDSRGEVFDAIVFGERTAGHWIAGSDFFKRTADFGGSPEGEAVERPVHLAIVYGADGAITAYRDGRQYGKPYKAESPVRFEAGKAQVLFGNRHGGPGGNKNLAGRIYKARLHDRALSAAEIAASASGDGQFVSERDMLAALTEDERARHEELRRHVERLRAELKALPEAAGTAEAHLAHALFNLKEFIYIR